MRKMKAPILMNMLWVSILTIGLLACSDSKKNDNEMSTEMKQNWAEKLGFPAGKKVIMLHADDVGMCEEANIATEYYLKNDYIQSAAIMVPCPNADYFIEWAIANPDKDVGLHLTLTSEWRDHRWTTISDPAEVSGLIDPDGKMWHHVPEVVEHASADEVEKEIRAQIDKSLSMGLKPSHIDTHMGTLYGDKEYIKRFYKVAQDYGIPANVLDMSDSLVVKGFKEEGYPIDDSIVALTEKYTLPKLDGFTSAPNGESYEDKVTKFKELIRSLEPGLTEIIFHPSVESEKLKTIAYSWQQRIWESKMFADKDLLKFFEEEGIIFTNWTEIMRRFNKTKIIKK
jgi:predicted glycoside hydrolase/deacetylase ChbG (UPF0249 family)